MVVSLGGLRGIILCQRLHDCTSIATGQVREVFSLVAVLQLVGDFSASTNLTVDRDGGFSGGVALSNRRWARL